MGPGVHKKGDRVPVIHDSLKSGLGDQINKSICWRTELGGRSSSGSRHLPTRSEAALSREKKDRMG